MAITRFTTDVQNVQALDDRPNSNTGLTADDLKAKFDKAGVDIKNYLNNTLAPEIETATNAYSDKIINPKSYSASGSEFSTTGSITQGTDRILLANVGDFIVGHGLLVEGVHEVASLEITVGASSSANCTVTLNGVAFAVALTSGHTATQVATAIRAASYAGWTTGGTGTTVTFTSNSSGTKTDAVYSAGTTGTTGTMTTTTQGTNNLIGTIQSIVNNVATLTATATTNMANRPVYHDDTSAINNALIASRTSNSIVMIPGGTYNTSSEITVIKHDRIIGIASEKTTIKAMTPGMTVFNLTVQESTLKDLFIVSDPSIYQNYTGIKLSGSNYVIDNIEIFFARKAIQVPSGGSYNNEISNLFLYHVNYGLYCEDGAIFNANRVHFRTVHGSGYDLPQTYAVGDIGLRVSGSVNTFTGGENAGFELGVEVVNGGENEFDFYSEKCLYGFKHNNTGTQVISKLHGASMYPGGDYSLIRTENGLGTPGATKKIGSTGFNAMQDCYLYYLFDQLSGTTGRTIYDYSGNKRHFTPSTTITLTDYRGVYGLSKSFAYTTAQAGNIITGALDGSTPFTFAWSCKAISHPATSSLNLKAVWITDSGGKYFRATQQANGSIAVDVNDGSVSFKFTSGSGTGDGEGFYALGVDFTNNLIYKFNPANGEYITVACDFSGFNKTNMTLRIMYKDASADAVEYAISYFFMYTRILNYGELYEIAKTKTFYHPNQQTRRFCGLATLGSNASIANNTETKVAHGTLTANDGITYDVANTRFVVPQGVKKVRLMAQVEFASNTTGLRGARIFKNGSAMTGYPIIYATPISGQTTILQSVIPTMEVTAGDYFEHMVIQTSGSALNATATNSWITIEAAE